MNVGKEIRDQIIRTESMMQDVGRLLSNGHGGSGSVPSLLAEPGREGMRCKETMEPAMTELFVGRER